MKSRSICRVVPKSRVSSLPKSFMVNKQTSVIYRGSMLAGSHFEQVDQCKVKDVIRSRRFAGIVPTATVDPDGLTMEASCFCSSEDTSSCSRECFFSKQTY